MPIEIRELVIRAEVDSSSGSRSTQQPAAAGQVTDDLIQQVVDKVVEILKNQKER
jgi:hypothetical protein